MLSATSGTLLHVKWAWENEVYARDSDKYACEIPTYIQGHQLRKQKKTVWWAEVWGLAARHMIVIYLLLDDLSLELVISDRESVKKKHMPVVWNSGEMNGLCLNSYPMGKGNSNFFVKENK